MTTKQQEYQQRRQAVKIRAPYYYYVCAGWQEMVWGQGAHGFIFWGANTTATTNATDTPHYMVNRAESDGWGRFGKCWYEPAWLLAVEWGDREHSSANVTHVCRRAFDLNKFWQHEGEPIEKAEGQQNTHILHMIMNMASVRQIPPNVLTVCARTSDHRSLTYLY